MELAEETLGITIEKVIVPEGEDLDNWLKTNLASGSAPDIISYNTGAQLKSLNPSEYFADLSGYDFVGNLDDTLCGGCFCRRKIIWRSFQDLLRPGAIFIIRPFMKSMAWKSPKRGMNLLPNLRCTEKKREKLRSSEAMRKKWTTQLPLLADNYNVVQQIRIFRPSLKRRCKVRYNTGSTSQLGKA